MSSDRIRLVNSSRQLALSNRLRQPTAIHLLRAGGNVVEHQPSHAAQLSNRVEVAHQRHPRISVLAVVFVEFLGGTKVGDIDPDQCRLHPPTRGTDAQVQPAWIVFARLPLQREEIVPHVEPLGREDIHLPQKQLMDLDIGVADRSRRGDDLGPNLLATHFPGTELVDGRFVQADQRTQRPANQMQFVLNNEVGWSKRASVAAWSPGASQSWSSGENPCPRFPASGIRGVNSGH